MVHIHTTSQREDSIKAGSGKPEDAAHIGIGARGGRCLGAEIDGLMALVHQQPAYRLQVVPVMPGNLLRALID